MTVMRWVMRGWHGAAAMLFYMAALLSVMLLVALAMNAARAAQLTPTVMLCATTAEVRAVMRKHGEKPVGVGVSIDGNTLIEMWVSPRGTYSILRSSATGVSCLIDAGKDWQMPTQKGRST
jgi:hypothetical protein